MLPSDAIVIVLQYAVPEPFFANSIQMPIDFAYWIVCPAITAQRPKIVAFRKWLLDEARHDEALLAQLGNAGDA